MRKPAKGLEVTTVCTTGRRRRDLQWQFRNAQRAYFFLEAFLAVFFAAFFFVAIKVSFLRISRTSLDSTYLVSTTRDP